MKWMCAALFLLSTCSMRCDGEGWGCPKYNIICDFLCKVQGYAYGYCNNQPERDGCHCVNKTSFEFQDGKISKKYLQDSGRYVEVLEVKTPHIIAIVTCISDQVKRPPMAPSFIPRQRQLQRCLRLHHLRQLALRYLFEIRCVPWAVPYANYIASSMEARLGTAFVENSSVIALAHNCNIFVVPIHRTSITLTEDTMLNN
ncbi:uncharacterized protein LOC119465269 isoform X5 [Dermacentor silvarum]|uniref:uncharacterized protein LOC119465269 isoform X5 n=1 Tax=Dermacentor silvarum TaxID=543639 RepID=UPI0021016A02|nr:uncharacterized protein LOC119465269 isoform X5 [Dermacentor silvarum]